jgi:hypothetical protein
LTRIKAVKKPIILRRRTLIMSFKTFALSLFTIVLITTEARAETKLDPKTSALVDPSEVTYEPLMESDVGMFLILRHKDKMIGRSKIYLNGVGWAEKEKTRMTELAIKEAELVLNNSKADGYKVFVSTEGKIEKSGLKIPKDCSEEVTRLKAKVASLEKEIEALKKGPSVAPETPPKSSVLGH